jgi:hypothetical protein
MKIEKLMNHGGGTSWLVEEIYNFMGVPFIRLGVPFIRLGAAMALKVSALRFSRSEGFR